MTWVKLDDHFDEHPKFAAAGPFGIAMFVCALAYCNRNLTDGYVPRGVAAHLFHDEWTDADGTLWKAAMTCGMQGEDVDLLEIAEHLVHVGLFEHAGHDGSTGYVVHDYGNFQPSKHRVLAERNAASGRMKKVRESRRSPEQKANTDVTPPEVQEKFEGSSPNPVPVPEPEVQEQSPNGDSSDSEKKSDVSVRRIFDYGRNTLDHPRWLFTADRKSKIRARLRDGYTEEQLCRAIDGVLLDPWDERRVAGNDDLAVVFRGGKEVDKFLALVDEPGTRNRMYRETEDEREQRLLRDLAARGPQ